jgi:hypothetical protein
MRAVSAMANAAGQALGQEPPLLFDLRIRSGEWKWEAEGTRGRAGSRHGRRQAGRGRHCAGGVVGI